MAAITEAFHDKALMGWHRQAPVPWPGRLNSEGTRRMPVFVAPYDCEVGVWVINSTLITGADTNTYHINLIDGGAEGAGTDEVATIDLVMGTDLAVGKTALLNESSERFLTKDDILEIEVEEIGTGLGSDQDGFSIVVIYRAANLGS